MPKKTYLLVSARGARHPYNKYAKKLKHSIWKFTFTCTHNREIRFFCEKFAECAHTTHTTTQKHKNININALALLAQQERTLPTHTHITSTLTCKLVLFYVQEATGQQPKATKKQQTVRHTPQQWSSRDGRMSGLQKEDQKIVQWVQNCTLLQHSLCKNRLGKEGSAGRTSHRMQSDSKITRKDEQGRSRTDRQ